MFAPLLFTLLTFTDDKMIKVVNEQASLDLLELLQNQRMCRRSWLETASPLVALKANFLGRTFKLNYVHVHLSRLRVMRSVVIGKPGLAMMRNFSAKSLHQGHSEMPHILSGWWWLNVTIEDHERYKNIPLDLGQLRNRLFWPWNLGVSDQTNWESISWGIQFGPNSITRFRPNWYSF